MWSSIRKKFLFAEGMRLSLCKRRLWTSLSEIKSSTTEELPLRVNPQPGRSAIVWGNGDYGRLGLGSLDSQWRPKLMSCSVFGNQNLKSIACGGAHTLFLTEAGHVYASGLNDFGQLGVPGTSTYSMVPLKLPGLDKEIVHISAGYHHSCAITVDGELYMWGRNSNGQLGLGKKAGNIVPLPSKVESLSGITIKTVALASEHSIGVTDGGETLSWGAGCGRLGHGYESSIFGFIKSVNEHTPRIIKKLDGVKVKNVAAGLLHSACIDENGVAYVLSDRSADKLGIDEVKNATTLSLIDKLPSCKEVSCGGYHTCVVTSGGELYTWGSNENGCLGVGSTIAFDLPQRVEDPLLSSGVDKVSCGWKHTAAISEGSIFTWGWGGSHGTFSEDGDSSGGQLGYGSDVDCISPRMVPIAKNIRALQVSCGFNHTGAIVEILDS